MDVRFKAGETKFNFRSAGILIENNHVLFHRQQQDSYWSLPGGGVEIGEATSESVVREWQEELGYDVSIESTLWIAESFFSEIRM